MSLERKCARCGYTDIGCVFSVDYRLPGWVTVHLGGLAAWDTCPDCFESFKKWGDGAFLEPTETQKKAFRSKGFCGFEWFDQSGKWFVCDLREGHAATDSDDTNGHAYCTANMTPYQLVAGD
jgi:hypothetical protein